MVKIDSFSYTVDISFLLQLRSQVKYQVHRLSSMNLQGHTRDLYWTVAVQQTHQSSANLKQFNKSTKH